MPERELHQYAAGMMQDISAVLVENERLRERVATLAHNLTAAEARIATLEGVLASTTLMKDRYMRHSVEMRTRLTDCMTSLSTALESARDEFNASNPLSADDARRVRLLAEKLAPIEDNNA